MPLNKETKPIVYKCYQQNSFTNHTYLTYIYKLALKPSMFYLAKTKPNQTKLNVIFSNVLPWNTLSFISSPF